MEVTVVRNPKAGRSKQEAKNCSESLSDSETVFRKPRPRYMHQSAARRERSRGGNKENMKSTFEPKSDIEELNKKLNETQFALEKSKLETSRYRNEYNVMVKQVDISKGTVSNLERQVADLKRIISKLTSSNGELLEIVSEKINYEDKLAVLQRENEELVSKLSDERSNSFVLRRRLESAEKEVDNLRSLALDLRSGLASGPQLAALARPPAPDIGDETRQVLGLGLPLQEEEADSAYDDPRTESIRSRPKSQQLRTSSTRKVFHKLNTELSESEDVDLKKDKEDNIDSAVNDLSLKFDNIQIPQPRPFEGSSLHLSLSSSDSDHQTLMSTLSEGKFLKGLEQSIDLSATKLSTQSD